MLSGIPRGERPIRETETEGILAEVAEGFAAVGSNPRMRLIMGLFGAQMFVSGAISVLIVVMALQLLDMGQSGVGLLNAADRRGWGAGQRGRRRAGRPRPPVPQLRGRAGRCGAFRSR